MKNIKKLEPLQSIVFKNESETLVLITNETKVKIITDETEYDKEYIGEVVFVNEDCIELKLSSPDPFSDNIEEIKWDYIEEINIVNN